MNEIHFWFKKNSVSRCPQILCSLRIENGDTQINNASNGRMDRKMELRMEILSWVPRCYALACVFVLHRVCLNQRDLQIWEYELSWSDQYGLWYESQLHVAQWRHWPALQDCLYASILSIMVRNKLCLVMSSYWFSRSLTNLLVLCIPRSYCIWRISPSRSCTQTYPCRATRYNCTKVNTVLTVRMVATTI